MNSAPTTPAVVDADPVAGTATWTAEGPEVWVDDAVALRWGSTVVSVHVMVAVSTAFDAVMITLRCRRHDRSRH